VGGVERLLIWFGALSIGTTLWYNSLKQQNKTKKVEKGKEKEREDEINK